MLGSYFAAFNDLPSFAFVLLSNVAVLTITKGIKDFSFGISFFGFLIGIISMLSNLDDPSSIGPSMAIALLIEFYSTMLDLVIISPARFMLSKLVKVLPCSNRYISTLYEWICKDIQDQLHYSLLRKEWNNNL